MCLYWRWQAGPRVRAQAGLCRFEPAEAMNRKIRPRRSIMNMAMRSALMMAALAVAQPAAAQTADELIEKSIAALGGRAAFAKVKTRIMSGTIRSEERRVGKECRSRGSSYHEKKKDKHR